MKLTMVNYLVVLSAWMAATATADGVRRRSHRGVRHLGGDHGSEGTEYHKMHEAKNKKESKETKNKSEFNDDMME